MQEHADEFKAGFEAAVKFNTGLKNGATDLVHAPVIEFKEEEEEVAAKKEDEGAEKKDAVDEAGESTKKAEDKKE